MMGSQSHAKTQDHREGQAVVGVVQVKEPDSTVHNVFTCKEGFSDVIKFLLLCVILNFQNQKTDLIILFVSAFLTVSVNSMGQHLGKKESPTDSKVSTPTLLSERT